MESYDIIVIGAGPGGYTLAAEAAAKGLSVAIVERDKAGGTCLNRGCIPTKALRASADLLTRMADCRSMGISLDAAPTPDYAAIAARKESVVDELRAGVETLLSKCEIVRGTARLVDSHTVEADGRRLTAPRIVIATGSSPARLPIPGADLCLTSDDLLAATSLPASLAIIGGGVIGMEFACIMAALGVKVTVVEYCKEILPPFDSEVAKRLRMSLKRRKIDIITSAAVKSVERRADGTLAVSYDAKNKTHELEAEAVLMAVGRRPVLPDGLKEVGVELTPRGFVVVDLAMNTSVDGILAIGDVNGLSLLAHSAEAQARVLLGADESTLAVVPAVAYTMPECATVGLTEDEAAASGRPVKVGKAMFRANGYAVAMAETDGLVKVVADATDNRLLGIHICGPGAAELIAEGALALRMELTAEQVASTIHAHPTLSETLAAACRNLC